MKRSQILFVTLVLCLSFLIPSVCVGEETISFKPTIVEAMNQTSTQWFSTSESRAMLAFLLAFDLSMIDDSPFAENKHEIDWSSGVFIAQSPMICLVYNLEEEYYLMVIYTPLDGEAYYSLGNADVCKTSNGFRDAFSHAFTSMDYSYYVASKSDIDGATETIQKVLVK